MKGIYQAPTEERELQSPVTEGNQEPQPVSHRHSSAETALSGNSGSCEEMDYEAAKLVRNPGSVIHPFRGKDSGVSMKVGRRLFAQNYDTVGELCSHRSDGFKS